MMKSIGEGSAKVTITEKDEAPPPLAIRLTTKAMRWIFLVKMLEHSIVPDAIFFTFVFEHPEKYIVAYSAIVSAWGFFSLDGKRV